MQLGKRKFVSDSFGVAEKYLEIANADESAAVVLKKQRLFNQSGYFFVQAMEKQIKYHIAKKNTGNNETLFNQLNAQLKHQIFQELNFSVLHNKVRYPIYSTRFQNYSFLELGERDCGTLQSMLATLKKYLDEISRRVS